MVRLVFVHPALSSCWLELKFSKSLFDHISVEDTDVSERTLGSTLAKGCCHTDSRGSSFITCLGTVSRRCHLEINP